MRKQVFTVGGQMLAEVAQGGCEVSVLGEIHNPREHGPGQPALGDRARAGGLDQTTSTGPSQPQPFPVILCFGWTPKASELSPGARWKGFWDKGCSQTPPVQFITK